MDENKKLISTNESTQAVEEFKYQLRDRVLEEMKTVDLHEMKYYSRFLTLIFETGKKEEGEYID